MGQRQLEKLGIDLDAQLVEQVWERVAQASRTWRREPRGPYWPQLGHAVCDRCCSRQAGFTHVTVGTTDVFHCARRERVLLRDIFRFGTATVFSLREVFV